MTPEKTLTVSAAVIRRDGRILICRRRTDQDHAGKWEFPGGKVEPGEQPEDALRRELQEELGIQTVIQGEIKRYQYSYPGRKPLQLIFFSVTEFAGDPDYNHFREVRWALPAELPSFDFLEGDVEFVKELAAQA
jgi:8-oxo-dGTP diphosphatase